VDGVSGETSSLPSVGRTALGVAAIRAAETERPDRLFADPYAAAFVAAARYRSPADAGEGITERTATEVSGRPGLVTWVVVRTRFLDDVVLAAGASGCPQVVIVGAGLDARAFRLDWPEGTRLWELDLPEVLAFKESVVRDQGWVPRCTRISVEVDLAEDWGRPLAAAGFDAGAPTVWLAEGLLAYLSPAARDSLLARMAELSVVGSRLGLTLAAPRRLEEWRARHPDGAATRPGDYVALWQSSAPDDPTAWLAQLGWQSRLFGVVERAAAYGRPVGAEEVAAHGAHLIEAVRG
jgi:methyltransferase (TIGR00027 family)